MSETPKRKRRPKLVLIPEQLAEQERQKKIRRFEREVNRKLQAILPEVNKRLDQKQE